MTFHSTTKGVVYLKATQGNELGKTSGKWTFVSLGYADLFVSNISHRAKYRSKTGIDDVTGSVENRRATAKQLLLDVEAKLGAEKMAEVADAIKQLHRKSLLELKVVIVDIFKGNADFQQRFLEFLPKRYRS